MSGRHTTPSSDSHSCCVCHKKFPLKRLHSLQHLRPATLQLMEEDLGELPENGFICEDDLNTLRRRHVEKLLEDERGELSALDRRVIADLGSGASTVQQVSQEGERRLSFGDKAADAVASFGGSWSFILLFTAILVIWMVINTIGLFSQPFDPYPFILLNLVLSCVAALQAPIIMMSQKRQEEKDRQRAENDYMVNLRAELEIRQLHEKIDHQMARQWERLAELQQIQIDLLERRATAEKYGKE
ncbi:DUF1003 domain-containing protein [Rhizobium paknamense]|uniref:Membrane protein n=1 Tax=Rhizobium paknamense TaxID=1206817 RepID=A0ABU0IE02_9HYPH|nr:DUF1003 domain-containing protein [Rhizobium paknamense]MDQ0456468.1 putative membrane protein [Rhizobium paknamense]